MFYPDQLISFINHMINNCQVIFIYSTTVKDCKMYKCLRAS
jgi:hypothetical protein